MVYEDGTSSVSGGITGNDLTYTKNFTVTNDGVANSNFGIWIKDYKVKDSNGVDATISYPEDWTYVLKNGDTIIKSGTFPTADGALISVYPLSMGETISLTFTLTYNYIDEEDAENLGLTLEEAAYQTADMGKVLSFDIVVVQTIDTLNNTNEGTLLYAINKEYQNNIIINESDLITTAGKDVSLTDESIIGTTEDDYGTSYYFRGNVKNNYVNYSGMCFRIVRVQGNGTIKLVLADENGTCDSETYSEDKETAFINNSATYQYSLNTVNYKDSNIVQVLNDWMNKEVIDSNGIVIRENNLDISKLDTTKWCNDTSFRSLDENLDVYGSYTRLYDRSKAKANLKCTYTNPENEVVSSIGILTADEVAFAGGAFSTINNSYYLYANSNNNSYWTMSPYNRSLQDYSMLLVNEREFNLTNSLVSSTACIRPVIVLKKDVMVTTKDVATNGAVGTQQNPYNID